MKTIMEEGGLHAVHRQVYLAAGGFVCSFGFGILQHLDLRRRPRGCFLFVLVIIQTMALFNVLFFDCDNSLCIRKDGEFEPLAIPGEVICKWLVEGLDESGKEIREERDFKAVVLFQSAVKKQCIKTQKTFEEIIKDYCGDAEGLIQALKRKAEEEKELLVDSGNRGSAGKFKRVLRELQEEHPVKKTKENKENYLVKADGRKVTAPKLSKACSQLQSQKLENLTLLAGMASVLHSFIPSSEPTSVASPGQYKDAAQQPLNGLSNNSELSAANILSDRSSLTCLTLSPRLLNSVSLLQNDSHACLDSELTPTRAHKPAQSFRLQSLKTAELGTSSKQSLAAVSVPTSDRKSSVSPCEGKMQKILFTCPKQAVSTPLKNPNYNVSRIDVDVQHAPQDAGPIVCVDESPHASFLSDLQHPDESMDFGNGEMQPFDTREMVYNSLSLVIVLMLTLKIQPNYWQK
ncbi:uncharacterized protein [Ambystoma mexicanum]|uniref:uncharacterized protein n=1 Tax=Ambystoma mexicanum TaxID=8296 RepID=UPI0037E78156